MSQTHPSLDGLTAPQPGRYLVAVSGGVDSVVLLDWLVGAGPGLELVVAHFDHGLRPNSKKDARFVEQLAQKHNLEFHLGVGDLPPGSNEAAARTARYHFLSQTRSDIGARAVIVAHHQDDLIETMILNLQRRTGRRGLTSLRSHDRLLRPFLGLPKTTLLAVAESRGLDWVEDPTNLDTRFARNWVRQEIIPKFDGPAKQKLVEIHQSMLSINDQIDRQLADYLKYVSYRRLGLVYPRDWFNSLPDGLASEVVHFWLAGLVGVWGRKAQIDYLVGQLRRLPAGKRLSLTTGQFISLTKRSIRLGQAPKPSSPSGLVSPKMLV